MRRIDVSRVADNLEWLARGRQTPPEVAAVLLEASRKLYALKSELLSCYRRLAKEEVLNIEDMDKNNENGSSDEMVSAILKKDGEPVLDMSVRDRLKELVEAEAEAEKWKKSAYEIASSLGSLVDLLKGGDHPDSDREQALASASKALEDFRNQRLNNGDD